MWFQNRVWALLLTALSGGACTLVLFDWICRISRISIGQGIFWQHKEAPAWWWGLVGVLLPLAALFARNKGKMLSRLASSCCPWSLLLPLFFLPKSLPVLGVELAIFGWGVFRLGYLWGPVLPKQEIPPVKAAVLVLLIWGVAAAFGYWSQFQAYITLFFIYGDWSQYAEHYLKLLQGAPLRAWLAGAGHFNPLVNVVMTGFLALWRAPETIFLVNALVVSSAVPLSFALVRKHGGGPQLALAAALAAALNPALSHQYLGFIYGFHPIAFMVPLMLGYFLAGKSPWRWLLFGASLLVQETAAVFWGGYGFYLLLSGKQRKAGALLLAVMVCWFFAVGHWILPWTHDTVQYTQMFHYSALGDSLWEAALSPILRPGAFWKAVLHPLSISFVLLSLAPLWFAVGAAGWKWIAVLPLYAGVCMQDSPHVKTIALQYSMEISVWFLAVTAMTWGGKKRAPQWWRVGLPAGNFITGSVGAVLAVTLLGWFLIGYAVPYGKYSIAWGIKGQDVRPSLKPYEGDILKYDRILSTSCLRNHFIFRNDAVCSFLEEPQAGDLVFLEMHNPLFDAPGGVESARLKLLYLPGAVFAGGFPCGSGWVTVWHVQSETRGGRPVLPVLSEMDYALLGNELPSGDPHIRVRVRRETGRYCFAVRVETVPDYDVDVGVQLGEVRNKVPFGVGACPAYLCPVGSVFEFALPDQGCSELRMQVFKRAGSAEAWQQWQKEKK